MLESKIQSDFINKMRDAGHKAMKVEWSNAGYPDVIVFRDFGLNMFVEVKQKGEVPRKLQASRMVELLNRGNEVFWYDGRLWGAKHIYELNRKYKEEELF